MTYQTMQFLYLSRINDMKVNLKSRKWVIGYMSKLLLFINRFIHVSVNDIKIVYSYRDKEYDI